MPTTSRPTARPTRTVARIAAFMPGASPPLVRIPIRFIWPRCYSRRMVRVERSGPVTTVILDRPAAKNAVDRDTAQALADAFRAFDADDGARVGVLYGDHGTFCAGRSRITVVT